MKNPPVDYLQHPIALLDVTDVIERLGVSRQTVYNLLNSGEIPSMIVGKRRRKISAVALQEYLERRHAESQDEQRG